MYCYIMFKKWVQMVAQQCVSCTPRYAWPSHGEGGRGQVCDASGTWYSEEVSEDPLWLVVSWFRSWKLVCIESAQYTGFLEVLNRLPHKCALVRSSKSYVLDIVHCSISHGVEKRGVVLLRVQFTSYLESLGLADWKKVPLKLLYQFRKIREKG